jgi:hypothetical protein
LQSPAYTFPMDSKQAKSEEFDRFTNLVDGVLSVPKADLERIKSEPWPEDKKDRMLGYLKKILKPTNAASHKSFPPSKPRSIQRTYSCTSRTSGGIL